MASSVANLFAPPLRNRGLAVVAILLVVAAGAAAIGNWVLPRPPDPATASRQAIIQWLVRADVTQQPMPQQVALVDRLERELKLGFDLSQGAGLSAARQAMLAKNTSAMKRLWFVQRAGQYHDVPRRQRDAFMDQRIATVMAWSHLEDALQRGAPNAGGAESAVVAFFGEIEQWVRSEPDSTLQAKMETAVHDGVVRWLAKHPLAEQSMAVRSELAARIAEQLDDGLQVNHFENFDRSEAKMLRENCELLMEAWLREQAAAYAALTAQEKPVFVGRKIDSVSNWGVLELLAPASGESQMPDVRAGLLRLLALTETWIERAPSDQRAPLRELVSAVQAQMLLRMLNRGG